MYAYVRVHTFMYWYILVCNDGTYQYTSVHTSMYQYILVCTSTSEYKPVHEFQWQPCFVHGTREYSISIKCHAIVHTDINAPVPTKVRCIGF